VVQTLHAYVSPEEGRRDKIRLDFNENTHGFKGVCEGLSASYLTSYPEYSEFVAQLAELWGLLPSQILLTNGSDEALCVIASTFIEPNVDTAVISAPTFGMIPHYLALAQAKIQAVPVTEDLAFDVNGLTDALQSHPKLVMLPSPDNPTGAVLPLAVLSAWCEQFPETLFVLDEAYVEYDGASALPLLARFENLLITRTFSKAWGLAALRLGAVLGHPKHIEALGQVRSPFSVNTMAIQAASQLLPMAESVYAQAQSTMALKQQVLSQLDQRGQAYHAAAGNFFLLAMGLEAEAFCTFCKDRGVLIRNRSTVPGMWGLIRVSVGTSDEMTSFLACLDSFRAERAVIFDLDDTLVDTSQSYDAVIAQLVDTLSGKPLVSGELRQLRAQGGHNDDWDATVALLQRRGVVVSRESIESQGKALYLQKARDIETMWIAPESLAKLAQHRRLLVVTGRPRDEYEPVWADRLAPYFEAVYCQDDFEGALRKPAPDILLGAMARADIRGGLYIGNAVDDVAAAHASGLMAVSVTTTLSRDQLENAGTDYVLDRLDDIGKVLTR